MQKIWGSRVGLLLYFLVLKEDFCTILVMLGNRPDLTLFS